MDFNWATFLTSSLPVLSLPGSDKVTTSIMTAKCIADSPGGRGRRYFPSSWVGVHGADWTYQPLPLNIPFWSKTHPEGSNSASGSALVACAPVTQRRRVQSSLRVERLAEIYFSPFNIGDCVSLVAHMATYMGCQAGQVVSLLGLSTVVQSLWASDHCHQDKSSGLMVPTWQQGFSPGVPVSSSN